MASKGTLKLIRKVILIAACLTLAIAASINLSKQASSGDPKANTLTICTSFYPTYVMTLNIVQDVPGVQLINIAPPDAGCLHNVQLSPADLLQIEKSDILIINGSGMEAYLTQVIDHFPDLKIIDSGQDLDLSSFDSINKESHADHAALNHQHEINPHTWVSPSLVSQQVQTIGKKLVELDPANSERYLANTTAYVAKLLDLKANMHERLAGINNRNIITFHEAFPYFAQEFDLRILAVVQQEAGSEPSAKELAQTIQLIRENQIKAIFVEPQYPETTAHTLAGETGARVYTLDPAVSGPLDDPDAYLKTMERNLDTLLEALKA